MKRSLINLIAKVFLGYTFLLLSFEVSAQEKPAYSVYLMGDSGEDYLAELPHYQDLQQELKESGKNSAIILLGDNIYPKGMPDLDDKHREQSENILAIQLDLLDGYQGSAFIIPGNHDWSKGTKDGLHKTINQELFVEDYTQNENIFVPHLGCPGPIEVPLDDDLALILMDTQWALHPWDKPKSQEGCQVNDVTEMLDLLEDVLNRNRDKKIIVAGHHPMITYGIHGGRTNWKDHIFPLTAASPGLYIPLPVIGSLFPIYRKYFGSLQDTANPKYHAFRSKMISLMENYPNVIYAAGHEHNLQYNYKDSVHYIVSGAGVKQTFARQKQYSEYAEQTTGYARVDFMQNGDVNLEYIASDSETIRSSFKTKLYTYKKPVEKQKVIEEIVQQDDVVVPASTQYNIKEKQYWLLGKNYRDVWNAPVKAEVFNIENVEDGLEIKKKGGGMQTRSLRMEASDDRQYSLRSIEKYAQKAIPDALRETFAERLVQDQISASHPYAAFVVPPLAQAAEVYHTNPKYFYLPDDPRLGEYQFDFAGGLYLFEERPSDNWKNADFFGNSKKIIGTLDLLKKLYKDNDNLVDQRWVLKSRMFDLWIGDWDRHDDQWRWATIKKKGKGDLYRPIPRDRDQAFFVNQGFLMSLVKKKYIMPKFQGFDYDLKYPAGFMFNARYFDRDFLNQLDRADWEQIIDSLTPRLTDQVIENAIRQFPDTVYALTGEEIISKLKARRGKIKNWGLEYYDFLSREVSVRGSFKKEYFELVRDNEGSHLKVYKSTKDDEREKLIFERKFLNHETKELRLYGLRGDDKFVITGKAKSAIKLRVIGGPGNDFIADSSRVSSLVRKTLIYDTRKKKNTIYKGKEGKDRTSNKPNVNNYQRNSFQYNKTIPLAYVNYNVDDGVWLGGGFNTTIHGFRKDPFKSKHNFVGAVALNTISWFFNYKGTFTEVVGPLDLKVDLAAYAPQFVRNFFGFGNESEFNQQANEIYNVDNAIDYYRVRFRNYSTLFALSKRLGKKASLDFGGHWQGFETSDDYDGEDRFILDFADSTQDFSIFDFKTYAGGLISFTYDSRNNPKLPLYGLYLNVETRGYAGLNNASKRFNRNTGVMSLYYTFKLPSLLTAAVRVGGGYNTGTSEYYQAQYLSGPRELRGYRITRFAGESKFYTNLELRYKFAEYKTKVTPFSFGLLGFFDTGRVWVENENSKLWHKGYGGGIWVAPLNAAALSLEVASSVEGTRFYVRLGYLF